MNSNNNILIQSIKDFFTPKMLKFSILPFVASIILLYGFFFMIAGTALDSLETLQINSLETSLIDGVPNTDYFAVNLERSELLEFLIHHTITSWVATFLLYTIGIFATLYFSIFVALLVIGFLTPFILRELQLRHYSDVAMKGYSNFFSFFLLALAWFLLMLLMYLLFLPLYFIPIVNIIAFNLPLYYFFHKMLIYDISSTICTKEEAMHIKFYHANTLRLKTLALFLLSLIPFVIFFAAVFYVIYLGHTYFLETKKLRAEG